MALDNRELVLLVLIVVPLIIIAATIVLTRWVTRPRTPKRRV
jgi:hypothetical protein